MFGPSMIGASLLVLSKLSQGAPSGQRYPTCDSYHYYDHGTNNCEHCRDICEKAEYKNTVEQCWEKCKAYAQFLHPAKARTQASVDNNDVNNNNNNNNNDFPQGAVIAIVMLGLCFILLTTTLFLKRKAIVRRFKRNNGREEAPLKQTAIVTQPDQDPNPSTPLQPESLASTSAGGAASEGTAGIQEEGEPDPEGAGNHSYNIFPAEEAAPLLKQQPTTPTPIPVSDEGRSGDYEMALLSGNYYSSSDPFALVTTPVPTLQYSSVEQDLDSTERKMYQSSMEPLECLIDGAGGEMATNHM